MNAWVPAQTLGQTRYKDELQNNAKKYAPKLHKVASMIAQNGGLKSVVLVGRKSFSAARLVLEKVLGAGKIATMAGEIPMLGTSRVKTFERFNNDLRGTKLQVLLATTEECGEGVTFLAVRQLHLVDAPEQWGEYSNICNIGLTVQSLTLVCSSKTVLI